MNLLPKSQNLSLLWNEMQSDPSPKSLAILGSAKVLVSRLIAKNSQRESWSITKSLVEHITGNAWIRTLTSPNRTFSPDQQVFWDHATEKLLNGEPLQYVVGKAWFRDRDFDVGPGVLIPRPETEELVQWVIDESETEPISILDIGTGSGCIAVSLAVALPGAEVTAIDISDEALAWAKRNIDLHAPRVNLLNEDILSSAAGESKTFEVIVANPPYVLESDAAEMGTHVLQHEPGLALFVPDDSPLLYYIKVCELARAWLPPEGRLYFEIHENFGGQVKDLLEKAGFVDVEVRKDIYDRNRMVRGRQSQAK
jgi:release factor glutamine methyltransferase